jgi:SAM-dependent methyltransferase
MWYALALVATISAIVIFLHWYSYRYLKNEIIRRRHWDLNICCGNTDGGGINADIVRHGDVPNFVKLDSVYRLPFADGQFDVVLCSHTAEHVDYPRRLDRELRRVGRTVVYILPPIWDLAACPGAQMAVPERPQGALRNASADSLAVRAAAAGEDGTKNSGLSRAARRQ